ncbi:uncharacterized protein LAESUDRAFT_752359 [Laetiporus sulphureus 93-53]|uniref:Uncharacterized protein n=1 Tax=Laetiporus sulphureus 93-53 TaxID=1314785 RepID=A0A165BZJ4_9APHY|nr:uncharacterized protein LAESUDRAFT_752359 [Laetiporus sulphureus 93-53]KZT01934.1 hypothetical protein LAESUDRAFT_752359 [Laetiporus sulphureus 93-53]
MSSLEASSIQYVSYQSAVRLLQITIEDMHRLAFVGEGRRDTHRNCSEQSSDDGGKKRLLSFCELPESPEASSIQYVSYQSAVGLLQITIEDTHRLAFVGEGRRDTHRNCSEQFSDDGGEERILPFCQLPARWSRLNLHKRYSKFQIDNGIDGKLRSRRFQREASE